MLFSHHMGFNCTIQQSLCGYNVCCVKETGEWEGRRGGEGRRGRGEGQGERGEGRGCTYVVHNIRVIKVNFNVVSYE